MKKVVLTVSWYEYKCLPTRKDARVDKTRLLTNKVTCLCRQLRKTFLRDWIKEKGMIVIRERI